MLRTALTLTALLVAAGCERKPAAVEAAAAFCSPDPVVAQVAATAAGGGCAQE